MRLHKAGPRPEQQFAMVPNETIRDKRLSFRARGILTYVLSHSDGYHVTADTVAEEGTEGREAIRTAWRELEAAGYLRRATEQAADGKFSTSIEVFAYPQEPTTGFRASVDGASVARASIEDQREDQEEDSLGKSLPSLTAGSGSDTVSDSVPDWVKKIEWMNPDKFTMACELAHHVDVVATLGHYVAWSDEHAVDQTYTRFWAWLAKAEAAAKAAKDDDDVNVRLMRTVRAAQREQQV